VACGIYEGLRQVAAGTDRLPVAYHPKESP
jgi:hypothetical protein